jgi:hypothetical protein
MADSTWTIGVRIGGQQDDTTLQGVMPPVVNRQGLFLSDMTAKRILHFDHAGRMRWQYGSPGGGPNELREPRDLEVGPSGELWVLDPANGRLTKLGPDGAPVGRIGLAQAGAVPYQFVPLEDGGAILVVRNPERPFIRVDSLGGVVTAAAFPWDDFSRMNPLATQLEVSADPGSRTWYAAFRLGDGFYRFEGDAWSGHGGRFVESIAFPVPVVTRSGNRTTTRFPSRPPSAAKSVTLSPERLYVLFGGATDQQGRLVDSYSRESGKYLSSYLLPDEAVSISWHNGGLYVLRENPYPEIVFLSPSASRLP